MATDPKVLEDLNTMAQFLAHIAGQFQIDKMNIKRYGLKWLAKKRVGCWYHEAEVHLRIVIERVLYLGGDISYDAGPTSANGENVEEIITRAAEIIYAAQDFAEKARRTSWDIVADYTPDVYEHIIRDLEKMYIEAEAELNLMKTLGLPNYIGARLED